MLEQKYQEYWRKPSYPHEVYWINPFDVRIREKEKWYMFTVPLRLPDYIFVEKLYKEKGDENTTDARNRLINILKEKGGFEKVVRDMDQCRKKWCWLWAYPCVIIQEREKGELTKLKDLFSPRFMSSVSGLFFRYKNDLSTKQTFKEKHPLPLSRRNLEKVYSNYPEFIYRISRAKKANQYINTFPDSSPRFKIALAIALGLIPEHKPLTVKS